MSDQTIRLCLATLEHDHAWWTLDHILSTPNVELVGVLDGDPARIARFREATRSGAAVFDAVDAMLESTRPDGLIVTAPNDEHRSLAEAALRRRIPCLVQKPMATSLEDARAMAATAEDVATPLMVNHFPLWQPARAAFFRHIAAGLVGEVRHISMWHGHQGPIGINVLTQDYIDWLYDLRRHGGGVLADQATYGIAYCLWALGRPQRVSASEVVVRELVPGCADGISVVTLEYPHAVAQIQGSWAWPYRVDEMRCLGSDGSLTFVDGTLTRRAATSSIHDAPDLLVMDVAAAGEPTTENGVAHFVHCIRTGTPIAEPHTASMNVAVIELTEAALRSARDGRSVATG